MPLKWFAMDQLWLYPDISRGRTAASVLALKSWLRRDTTDKPRHQLPARGATAACPIRIRLLRAERRRLVEWLAPIVLLPATIVVLVLCTRSAVRALRAEKEQRKDLGSNREEED